MLTKIDKKDVREIIREEIREYGVAKSEFIDFKDQINGKLDQLITYAQRNAGNINSLQGELLLTQHTLSEHLDNHTSHSNL